MSITAAVDGSALGNPGPAGWAWVVSEDAWAAGGFDRATNNVGELMALAKLLEDTAEAGLDDQPLVVLADSQYVINSVTKWMPGWKRRGWKKADGKPVMNRELLERIDRAMSGRELKFEWVKGHAGHHLNEAADLRARAAAEAHKNRRSVPTGPAFTKMIGSKTALPERLGSGQPRDLASSGQLRDLASSGQPRDLASSGQPRDSKSPSPEQKPAGRWSVEPQASPVAPSIEPIVAVSAAELPRRLREVLDAAAGEPVTITDPGKPPLLLLDADTAWRALALLDEEVEVDEGTLF